jgi:protein gp37
MSSSIEWTDETWNPIVGCERCSPGCDHCYAIRVAAREMQPAHVDLTERAHRPAISTTSDGSALDWTGEVRLLPDRLEAPLRWRKPRRCFVCSMSDLFHPDVPDDYIAAIWEVMLYANQHTFQILTKRPQRMARLVGRRLPNVWVGTSVENQRYADLRIPHLLATPAAVRFLSIEPLLGPVDLEAYLLDEPEHEELGPRLDWVIAGGESGPGARPMHPEWVRSIRDQCTDAGVPFFFKQWGEHDDRRARVGKKRAGRILDGRTWDQMPDETDAS